uniref:Histone domain-containing protein n=1 Tax=Angiostrongylus cantonensis TaxID=6313 RepID=A0A0K0D1E4_ANGCA
MPPKPSAKKAAKSQKASCTGDRKKHRRKVSYSVYIYRVLKQAHPDTGVSSKAMSIISSFLNDVFERIATKASRLAKQAFDDLLPRILDRYATDVARELAKHAVFEGCGKIIFLAKSHAIVCSLTHGEIRCSLLSWIGGDGGSGAEWLTDILNVGDTVLYTAAKRGGEKEWRVVKWTAKGFRIGSDHVPLADSYCQTAVSVPELGMRYILPMLEHTLYGKPTLRHFLS